jgi:hypothetical protein
MLVKLPKTMKTMKTMLPIVLLAAAATATALASPVSFHSTSSGSFSILTDPALPVFDVGIAHPNVVATPFTFQSLYAEQTVDLTGVPTITGSFTLTDPNGFLLSGAYVTDLTFLGPTEAVANGTFSFTGGTGPFQKASGGGNMMAAIHLATGTSEITIDGRITVPDAGDPLAPAMLSLLGLTFIQRRSRQMPSNAVAC